MHHLHITIGLIFSIIGAMSGVAEAQTDVWQSVFHPISRAGASSQPAAQAKQWAQFQQQRQVLHQILRTSLTQHCAHRGRALQPMADLQGRISLQSREARMVAIDLRIRRLQQYRILLARAQQVAQYEQKVMRIGYILSDALLGLGSYGLSQSLKVPWLSVIMPVGSKLTSQLIDAQGRTLPQPSPFQVHIDDDLARLLQVMQFQLHPGPYRHVACYLSATKLRDALGQPCHPDHPFIRQRYAQLSQLWQQSQLILRASDLPPFWSHVFEFLTHRRVKELQTQELYLVSSAALLEIQIQFLQKIRAILLHDYRVWGCQQLQQLQRTHSPRRLPI